MDMETEVKRGPGRPPINRTPPREIDHKARARERMEALKGSLPSQEEQVDRFHIPRDIVPDGWSYEWKRHTLVGKEDPAYFINLQRSGWEPVPASRHPDMMPAGYEGPIQRDGMMLMERPKELTDAAHDAHNRNARNQIRMKEASLGLTPSGTLPRDAHAGVKPRINKEYAPIEIPE